jgi:hypothetical protein
MPTEPDGRPRLGTVEAGTEPGRQVVALGFALTLTAVSLDVVMAGRLTLLFDLAFISTCLLVAVLVRRGDFFTVSLLPPLLMLGVVTLLALVARGAVADPGDGVIQAIASGVAHHGIALFAGYVLALGWLGWRLRSEDAIAAELGTDPTPHDVDDVSADPSGSALEA